MACEYIMLEGNRQVVLCERGITTFEDATRYTTDLNAVPVLERRQPSAGDRGPQPLAPATGATSAAVAKGAVAAGADGLMVEVHPRPAEALSDGPQSLEPARFAALMDELRAIAQAVGRTFRRPRARGAGQLRSLRGRGEGLPAEALAKAGEGAAQCP